MTNYQKQAYIPFQCLQINICYVVGKHALITSKEKWEWNVIASEIKERYIKLFIVPLALNYESKSHITTLVSHLISNHIDIQLLSIHQTMSWQILITVLLPAFVAEVIKANQFLLLQVDHFDIMMSCFI